MGEEGGAGIQIPQPLVIKGNISTYPSRNAVIADIAIKLFMNTNFGSRTNVNQAAKNAVMRAKTFASVAGDMIDALVTEQIIFIFIEVKFKLKLRKR